MKIAKTLLLTSAEMEVKEEILKALPKPAGQINLAYIITASKPEINLDYLEKDRQKMIDLEFQVEDIDIEGKKVIKELLEKGVIYIGVSAGSILAGPTIETAGWKHQDRNIVGIADLTALNFVPFLIFVHYEPSHRALLQKEIPRSKYPVRILTDKQAFLVKGNEIELVGHGEEIKI